MAYDEGLAARLRNIFEGRTDVVEKKMFGGIAFMVGGHMCCGIIKDTLMARVGPEQHEAALQQPHVRVMDFTGKPMKGYLYVEPQAIESEAALRSWARMCEHFVATLPPKKK